MTNSLSFTALDWAILAAYVLVLGVAGWLASRRTLKSADDYFLASHHAPTWLVAVSVLSTVQSAATFLGVPDNSYRGNWTYLTSVIGALLGVYITARVLIPRFYAIGAATVYELLEQRFSRTARQAAAAMYLLGRVLASGARLYLAAIAVSMILFLDVQAHQIVIAAFILLVFGLAFTFMGGLNAVIWSDLFQVVLYLGAALTVLVFLLIKTPASPADIVAALSTSPGGVDKLKVFDWSLDFSAPFAMFAVLVGMTLLNIGNAGLDQDTTQRALACENAQQGGRALTASVWASVPVIALFLLIGSLLHVFYQRPDLMGGQGGTVAQTFQGENITVFMHFILSQIPPGLRGLVTVGIIAAAAINSGLISMSAVVVNDFYRPWAAQRGRVEGPGLVWAGRLVTVLLGCALFGMSILCFYWQRATDTPLLEFALGVMVFAYSGLLGVYITALFTGRGSTASVLAALVVGFIVVLLFQPYVADALGLPVMFKGVAFPWQLCAGTVVATLVCLLGRGATR
jgi:solute:Na+ symporter, SSS family